MSTLAVFWYERIHFIRNPFKVVALLLFAAAGIYGLHNGAALYDSQLAEIENIKIKTEERIQETLAFYEEGKKGPEARPWVDVSQPFWALRFATPTHYYKQPSAAMVYSIGQAEQYGFYKQVSAWSSPYDADMAEEIANPERLQAGVLDFSFVIWYLLPLLLLIMLYNIKGAEAEAGFLLLIYAQTGAKTSWLLARVSFYVALLGLTLLSLMVYGALLNGVFSSVAAVFAPISLYLLLYLLLWAAAYFFILQTGTSSVVNTMKMAGSWLLVAFILPALVHQWVSIAYPTNLMTEWVDAQRNGRQRIYELPDSVLQANLEELFPAIADSPLRQDPDRIGYARSRSYSALSNELMKSISVPIEQQNEDRNALIRSTYWLNPIAFFQNRVNSLTATHFQDYKGYRTNIQGLVDQQVSVLMQELWKGEKVDKEKYLEYHKQFRQEHYQ
ncbi:MAG: hypothetical protein AAF798_08205 [Bacteroidota bacterium]